MQRVLSEIEPEKVFQFFEEISNIPRGSGNEKEISDYLVQFAKQRNLKVIQDQVYNVVIKKEAVKGQENASPVILQSHIDMVCEKEDDIEHDFKKDGLELYVEGDFLKAKGTTLGADNGIGVAFILAILDDANLIHPKIEAVFTVEEETTMKGAKQIDTAVLDSKRVISLDNMKEGEFTVGSANMIDLFLSKECKREEIDHGYQAYILKISGLIGGHSGTQIHLERGNANCLMGRLLNDLSKNINYKLQSINGGMVSNSIPRENETVLYVKQEDKSIFIKICDQYNEMYQKEFSQSDKNVAVSCKEIENTNKAVLNEDTKNSVVNFLHLAPNSVQNMSTNVKGLVETSANIRSD